MSRIKKFFLKEFSRLHSFLKGGYYNILSEMLPLGLRGERCYIGQPSFITRPQCVFMHDYACMGPYNVVLNNEGKLIMGKYSVAATGLRVVPDLHISTVGIPQCCLGASHIHDKVMDVIVEEDVWLGTNVTLLGGCHVRRGCIIGANTLVNKRTLCPPYSVIAGSPARIIAVKFNIEQILQHEEKLYAPSDRLSPKELEELFETFYKDKRVYGVDGNLTDEERLRLERVMQHKGVKLPD
ncbi:MAG: hypothetical protein J1E57_00615 [Prevotella sp.]|nr:hypothetical protein [Prevotella sp.]